MKKLFTLCFFLLGISSLSFSQQKVVEIAPADPAVSGSPVLKSSTLGNAKASGASGTRAACGLDTLIYTEWKSNTFTPINLDPGPPTNGTALYQIFEGPQAITVSGATVHVYRDFTFPGTSQVSVELQLINSVDSLPTGTVIASDTLDLLPTFFFGLASVQQSATWAPVTVTDDYAIVIRNLNDTIPINFAANNWANNDGQSEWLSGGLFGPAWTRSYLMNIGGNPFDADVIIAPYVSYDINPSFTSSPECLFQPGTVVFENTGAPIVDSRMYNVYVYNGQFNNQLWNFGDGSAPTNFPNPTYTYLSNAPFIVDLTASVRQWNGNICTEFSSSVVKNKPDQTFSYDIDGFEVEFTNLTFGAFTNPMWDFGDGNTSSATHPTHTFSGPGTYLVCMSIESTCGVTTVCENVAVAGLPTLSCGFDSVQYTLARTTAIEDIGIRANSPVTKLGQFFETVQPMTIRGFTFYGWHNGPQDSLIEVTCNLYQAANNKLPNGAAPLATTTVRINSEGGSGARNDTTKVTVIFPQPVILQDDYVLSIENDSTTIDCRVLTSDWIAEDGQGDFIGLAFQSGVWVQGNFFNVSGSEFDADVLIEPIIEYNYNASFEYDPLCLRLPEIAEFTNLSSTITQSDMYNQTAFFSTFAESYEWDFDDGSLIQNAVDPAHFYPETAIGPFNVTLTKTITGWTNTCISTQTLNLPVYPVADFDFTINTSQVDFTDNSPNAAEWLWLFSDGTTSTLQNPVHYFPSTGIFEVCLLASNVCGSDTLCETVLIEAVGIDDPVSLEENLEVYPNPANTQLSVSYGNIKSGNVQLELMDLTGRIVRTKTRTASENKTTINTSDLAEGTYFVRVKADEELVVRKIVVTH